MCIQGKIQAQNKQEISWVHYNLTLLNKQLIDFLIILRVLENYDLDIDGFDVDRIGAGSRTAYDDYFGESTYPLLVPAQQQGSRVPRGIIEGKFYVCKFSDSLLTNTKFQNAVNKRVTYPIWSSTADHSK